MKILFPITAALFLFACGEQETSQQVQQEIAESQVVEQPAQKPKALSLDEILARQPDEAQQRYQYRHPKETLEFFGLKPGMTVVEALPGGGWYSKILSPYIGSQGKLIGVDYDYEMWPNFSFVKEDFLTQRKTWPQDWPEETKAWNTDGASISAYTFATLPAELSDSVDMVLFIRALHNLNRFEAKGQFISKALQETYRILKPGGVVGVVQHQAAEEKADEWADGSRGYLKKSALINTFKNAGFVLLNESDINANPKDQPGEEDIVWRLPPSFYNTGEDEALKAKMAEIGESNRMTLLFQKSAG